MRYAQIRKMDISDGPGIRVALYTQGCSIHCKNCHNASIWDFEGGKEFCRETIDKILELSKQDYIAGLSILGGEPFEECNLDLLLSLVMRFKSVYPNKTIWIWSGHTYDSINDILYRQYMKYNFKSDVLNIVDKLVRPQEWICTNFWKYVDVLVDGPYIEEQKNPNLKYCGSENQRVINVKKTLEKGEVVLYEISR